MAENKDVAYLIEIFKDFEVPPGFNGGCIMSRLQNFCYRLKPDGTIGSITENCEAWENCKGYKYSYKIT